MEDMMPAQRLRLRALRYDNRRHKQWHEGDIGVAPDTRWLDAMKALHGVKRMGTITSTASGFRWETGA